jgi:hypothetical protein
MLAYNKLGLSAIAATAVSGGMVAYILLTLATCHVLGVVAATAAVESTEMTSTLPQQQPMIMVWLTTSAASEIQDPFATCPFESIYPVNLCL